jgi:hypothetical protein
MNAPDYETLVAAVMWTIPERRRTLKPEAAERDARRIASGILANWPKHPPIERKTRPGMTVMVRDMRLGDRILEVDPLETLLIEGAGVRAQVHVGDGELSFRAEAMGVEGIYRLATKRFSYNDMQTLIDLKGTGQ